MTGHNPAGICLIRVGNRILKLNKLVSIYLGCRLCGNSLRNTLQHTVYFSDCALKKLTLHPSGDTLRHVGHYKRGDVKVGVVDQALRHLRKRTGKEALKRDTAKLTGRGLKLYKLVLIRHLNILRVRRIERNGKLALYVVMGRLIKYRGDLMHLLNNLVCDGGRDNGTVIGSGQVIRSFLENYASKIVCEGSLLFLFALFLFLLLFRFRCLSKLVLLRSLHLLNGYVQRLYFLFQLIKLLVFLFGKCSYLGFNCLSKLLHFLNYCISLFL